MVEPTTKKSSLDPSQLKLTWEPAIVKSIRERVRLRNPNQRWPDRRPFMVAIVGIPGSGKSTSSLILADMLSKGGNDEPQIPTIVIPFDGYHYSLKTLRSFENAQDAIYRRGAPDTFDAKALRKDLGRIRNGSEEAVAMPGFDHAKGDPEPGSHIFLRDEHEVVICEGLYLLHDEDEWGDVLHFFDLSVYMSADVDVCVKRLKERNKCIPGYTPEEIDIRCEVVDRKNAMTVQRSQKRADIVVMSSSS